MAFSPDGKRLAFGVGIGIWDETKQAYPAVELLVRDAQTGQELLALKGQLSQLLRETIGTIILR